MPVRVRALPPGEFIRDHLVAVGGMDYPQSVHRAYKAYLKAQGVDGTSRASMSKYFWLCNRMGLIAFDHAEAPSRWDGVVDGVTVPVTYRRERRPHAPSPRHYYRILDPRDPRWTRLEASYRESIGLPVPVAFPRVPVALPRPEVRPPRPPRKPRVPKPPKPPRVERPPKPPAVTAAPFEARAEEISALLDRLLEAPSLEAVGEIESRLLDLGDEVLKAHKETRGAEREKLGDLNSRLRRALENVGPLRASLTSMVSETLPRRIAAAQRSFAATARILKEDLKGGS